MAIAEHCCRRVTAKNETQFSKAPIAATAATARGSRRTDAPSTPPSAATRTPARRVSIPHRIGPSAPAPGWLTVGNAGETNTIATPARRARTNPARPCAELVSPPLPHPSRTCRPAPTGTAPAPATTSGNRRARHTAATSRNSPARPGAPSCRNTTPHNPTGSARTAATTSPIRPASVNSHNGGSFGRRPLFTERALTARPHATSL